MLSAVSGPLTKAASTYVSVVNAVNFGLLKKLGILKEGTFRFVETLSSPEEYNRRIDTDKPASFGFHAEAVANLAGFLDPTNEDDFLTWSMGENSYVTLPGIAESAPIVRGTIRLHQLQDVEYFFTFLGNDEKNYYFRGIKNLRDLHQVRAWTTLAGSVYKRETGEKILETTVFTGGMSSFDSLLPTWKSVSIR